MNHVASLKDKFLENFYLKSKRSIAKARAEGPAAYVFPGDDPRPGQAARLLRQLQAQGVEVHRADKAFKVKDAEYPAGSYVVRMDQPYSRMADMMLDKQYFNVNDPQPYDDVGWTLGPLYNVKTVRVDDVAVLDAPMTLVKGDVTAPGGVTRLGKGAVQAYLINHNADNVLATFRFAHKDLKIQAAEKDFEAQGRKFRAGSFIIKPGDNPGDLEGVLDEAGEEARLRRRRPSPAVPDVPTHEVGAPRVAVMHTWQNTQTEGWLRIALDECGIPYDYISVHAVRDNAKLRDKYDVIIFGPSSPDPLSVVNGLTRRQAHALEEDRRSRRTSASRTRPTTCAAASSSTASCTCAISSGTAASSSPSATARPCPSSSAWPRDCRSATRRSSGPAAASSRPRSATRRARSSTATTTRSASTSASRPSSAMGGMGGRAMGDDAGDGRAAAGRVSGRGGANDPDIAQGRPRDLGQKAVEEFRKAQKAAAEADGRGGPGSARPAASPSPGRASSSASPGAPPTSSSAAAWPAARSWPARRRSSTSTLGKGHVVLFSFNPAWRSETHGLLFLYFQRPAELEEPGRQAEVRAARAGYRTTQYERPAPYFIRLISEASQPALT